jgi:hypothetical protein
VGRMKTIDKRQDKSEDLGPAAVVGASTLKPRDGGGKVVPPKEPAQRSGPPLAFETPANPELVTDVTVGTTNLTPSPLPLDQPPFSPIDGWCGACGSGLWQDIKTERIACLYKKECPIALSNEQPLELTQEQAFVMLAYALPHPAAVPVALSPLEPDEAWYRLISERMDIDYAVICEMVAVERNRVAELEQHRASIQTARKDVLERLTTLTQEMDAGVREALDLKEVEERKLNGLVCTVCSLEQFITSAGPTCDNGHGGAEGIRPALYHHLPLDIPPDELVAPSSPAAVEMDYSPPRDIEARRVKRSQLVDSIFRHNYGPQAPTAPAAEPLVISSSSGIRIEIPAVLTKDADFVNLLRALRVLLGPA